MPKRNKLKCLELGEPTSNLAPEEDCSFLTWEIILKSLEGEVEAGTFFNVKGAAVGRLDVLKFARQFRNFHLKIY